MTDEMSVPKELIQAVQAAVRPVGDDGSVNPTIERVAKAIHACYAANDYCDYSYLWGHPLSSQEMFRTVARAAVEAMREPTEAMVDKGLYDDDDFNLLGTSDHALAEAYTRMIDASLTAPTAEPGKG